MKVPDWALQLTAEVMAYKKLKVKPVLLWRKKDRPTSSGSCTYPHKWIKVYVRKGRVHDWVEINRRLRKTPTYRNRYVVRMTVGNDEKDVKHVLLHELAHVVTGKRPVAHGADFYRNAFDIYMKFGIDLEYHRQREEKYRKESVRQFNYVMRNMA